MSDYKYTVIGPNRALFEHKISFLINWHAQYEADYSGTGAEYLEGEKMLTYSIDLLSELHRYRTKRFFKEHFTSMENRLRHVIASLIKLSQQYRKYGRAPNPPPQSVAVVEVDLTD